MHKCVALLACGFVALSGAPRHHQGCPGAQVLALVSGYAGAMAQPADDKKDHKDKSTLSGTWVKKGGKIEIVFADKDVLKIYPHGGDDTTVVVCDYTAEKDGLVKAKVNELQGEGTAKLQGKVPVGLEFTFTWKGKDNTARLDDVKGEKADVIKAHMPGDYEKK
jgi:hypothetical protein